jgi:probable phosphoglycerate mutase
VSNDAAADASITRLVLVRHGESVATANRYIGGHRTCKGLTDLGVRQARALRDRWASAPDFTADVLISSHFPRAIETGDIVALALGGLPVLVDPAVGEHDPGPMVDGMPFDEYVRRWGAGPDWEDPYQTVFEGGETMSAFHHRVATALHAIAAEHAGRTAVVFCHGGVVDVAFRSFLRLSIAGGFELHTLNTSITSFVRLSSTKWRLERYNDSAHLVGLT